MQILKSYNKDLISEIALQCGDSQFNDFNESVYAQSVFRAQRAVAKEYGVLERTVEFTTETETWETIPIKNLRAEFYLSVNDTQYTKRNEIDELETYEYYVRVSEDSDWELNYTDKAVGDEILMKYVSLGETSDEQDGTPILPDKYYEEIINRAVIYIAKLGIAGFSGGKRDKYNLIFKMNIKNSESILGKDSSWISVKPLSYP